jgi:putative Mn2+ efflux pump MntP
MTLIQLLALGLVIGSNNLAAALALGALGQASRRVRIVVVFSVFEFVIPLVGIGLGQTAARWVATHAEWISAALLVALGVWAIVMGMRDTHDDERLAHRATTWYGLLLLAGGLSLDNLIVGFSLGLGRMDPLVVATTIAAFSAAFTWVGLGLGDASRRHWERWSAVGAGLLLVALGVADALGVV